MYIQESMAVCFLIYFLFHLQDKQIISLAKETLEISQNRLIQIKNFFQTENFPVPVGYSEGDVNLAAPPLFHDTYALSFIYMMNRLSMINFSFTASNNVRLDVLDFFNECIHTSTEIFGKAVRMMLEKGIYDRPYPFLALSYDDYRGYAWVLWDFACYACASCSLIKT